MEYSGEQEEADINEESSSKTTLKPADVPSIDLRLWLHGDAGAGQDIADRVDAALQDCGFLLVTGHEVPSELQVTVRDAGRRFFVLPLRVKQRYLDTVGGRGWIPTGAEANGCSSGIRTPPDLKESFSVGNDEPTGDAHIDREWFPANMWPTELPEMRPATVEYLGRMRTLAQRILTLCAAALGLEPTFFTARTTHPTFSTRRGPAVPRVLLRSKPHGTVEASSTTRGAERGSRCGSLQATISGANSERLS